MPSLFLTELKAVFALFDKDGDGFVTISEVTDVLLSMGISPSADSIREIFQQVDLDGELDCISNLCSVLLMLSVHCPGCPLDSISWKLCI